VVKKYPKAIVKLVTLDHNQFNRAETNDVEAADETVLNSDRCYRRARAHIDKGERDLALRQLDRAVALHSRNLDAILWRANLHVQAGKKDLAAQDLEKAIQLGLKRADQYCHLARIYRDLGDYEKAAEALQKAEEMGAQSQDLYEEWKELGLVTKVVAGLAAEGADFYEMSIKAYRKAITFVPAISSEIARDWYDPNRTPEKVFMFNDLLSVEGETAELLNRIGITYEHWGKLDEAIESYLEALEHHDDAETHYLLGLAYKAKAMSEFEQIWTDERWQYHAMREVIAPLAPILIKGAILIRSGIHLKDLARELNEDVDKVAAAAEEILKAGAPSVSREDIVVDLDLDVPDIWLKANLASLVAAKFWILAIEE
jgi:tetratricopeptide (TPR) repeat protein